jgi:regulator of sirC expression with transglutaminase-like and TPR domain
MVMYEYPELRPESTLARLDHFADRCRPRLLPGMSVADCAAQLGGFLFGELGFNGDLKSFNDPRNSFLNEVLERRLGIPISLSVVYVEVARRLDLPAYGISFPGHFLVGVDCGDSTLVLDAFAQGRVLDRLELVRRLQHFTKDQQERFDLDELLKPASNREILLRMLRNLKTNYLSAEDYPRALQIVNLALCVRGDAAEEIRDRAFIHDRLEWIHAAIADYQAYLMLSPASSDTGFVQSRLADLRHSAQRLH